MADALQHVALSCRDRDAQEAFYVRHFGFRRARVFKAGRPDQFVMLRLGQTLMELFQAEDPPPEATGGPQEVGFKHLCFEVPDVEEMAARLRALGVETGEVIDCPDVARDMRICFLKDTEGNVIELMQGWQDDPALAAR